MSRIHDALKMAQQERAANPNLAEAPDGVLVPGLMTTLESPAAAREAPTVAYGTPEGASEPLSLEWLQARCPASPWNLTSDLLLFAGAKDQSPAAEQFRTLRSRLYQIRDKQPLQTVLVASALPGEGKTFISVNLAQAIVQQRNRSVLLMDGDLRRSRTHEMLGASATPGLSDYLRGDADALSILQRGPEGNLFFIGGGSPVSNPVELISTGRLKILLHRLAPVFDWIILDSPPSVPLSDASLLAELCDGVLMVVRSGETPFDMAQKTRQEFQHRHLVGVVLNRVTPGSTYTSYYYGYSGGEASKNGNKKD